MTSPRAGCAWTRAGTALVVSTVKSTSGPATHLVGLARLTPAGALDAAFGTAGTRTQDVSPSHITDAAALVTLPDGGFVVGGAIGVGSTSQFGLAGYHADGSPDTTLNPANATAANAANLQVGTGGIDRISALAVTPQGRLIAAGDSRDAERAGPQRDRPPRRRRALPAGQRRGDVGAGGARPRGPARPDRRLRRFGLDRS